MLTTAANYADFTPFRGRFAYRQRAKSVLKSCSLRTLRNF
jgi:hypothetical protein